MCVDRLYCRHKNYTPASVTPTVELEMGVAPTIRLAEEDVIYIVELLLKPLEEVPSGLDNYTFISKLGTCTHVQYTGAAQTLIIS